MKKIHIDDLCLVTPKPVVAISSQRMSELFSLDEIKQMIADKSVTLLMDHAGYGVPIRMIDFGDMDLSKYGEVHYSPQIVADRRKVVKCTAPVYPMSDWFPIDDGTPQA